MVYWVEIESQGSQIKQATIDGKNTKTVYRSARVTNKRNKKDVINLKVRLKSKRLLKRLCFLFYFLGFLKKPISFV